MEHLIDYNKFLAAAMMLATVVVLAVIVYFVFHAKAKNKAAPKQTDAAGDDQARIAAKPYAHCELNDIMGYDFIQVQTPVAPVELKPAEKKPDFAHSEGIGMTNREIGTTGARPPGFDDEPVPTKQQQEMNREQERKNRELERKAEQEMMTKVDSETIQMFGNPEWSEQFENFGEDSQRDFIKYMEGRDLSEFGMTDEPDEDEDTQEMERLSEKPKDPAAYYENLRKMEEIIESFDNAMSHDNFTEEQLAAISKIERDD